MKLFNFQIAYKVVYRCPKTGDRLNAVEEIRAHKDLRIKYEPNVLIKPKIGKIFVFASLYEAMSFMGSWGNYEVWEVKANNAKLGRLCLHVFNIPSCSESEIKNWWKTYRNEYYYNNVPPQGTLYCESLEMIRRVAKTRDVAD